MPVLMIATYNEDDTVDVMNMAWGGICDHDKVALNLEESHKTVANIKARRAFTVSVADVARKGYSPGLSALRKRQDYARRAKKMPGITEVKAYTLCRRKALVVSVRHEKL